METWISWRLVREHQPRKVGPQLLQRRHDFLVDLAEDTLLRVAIPMTTIQELHIPYLCMPWTARFCPTGCPGYPAPWGGYIEIPGAFSSRNALGCRWCSTRSTSKKSSPRASSKPRRSPRPWMGMTGWGGPFTEKFVSGWHQHNSPWWWCFSGQKLTSFRESQPAENGDNQQVFRTHWRYCATYEKLWKLC